MNPYQVLILSALFLKFLIDCVAEWLNLQSLTPEVPAGFSDLYDTVKYRRSQEYTRVKTRFGFVQSLFGLALFLSFWFLQGFDRLDLVVRGWNQGPVLSGLLYIGMLLVAGELLSLPFAVYFTFVIEERFGFNRTTLRTFLADLVKGFLLQTVLGGALLALVLWLFQVAGPGAWVYCWIASSLLVLLAQYLTPILILPLFNKFTPLEEGELRAAIRDYAKSVNFSFKEISVMDGSRRSTKANAFFTGFGNHKRIALYDTLVAGNTVAEVVSVLAHEVGHYKMRHVPRMMVVSLFHLGALFFLFSLFLNNGGLFGAFYMQSLSTYASLVFFGLLYEPVSFFLSIALNAYSRKNEFEADDYSVRTAGNPEVLVSSLKKLSVKNLSNLTPHPFYVFLHYSHPPLLQRIHRIHFGRNSSPLTEPAKAHG